MQSYTRLNMQRELTLLAHGKRIHTRPEIVADWALRAIKGGLPEHPRDDSRRWLEKLYALEDPRHA